MRDYEREFSLRTEYIRDLLKNSGAAGIVYGNSGGKDSALVGILCKAACDNTLGLIMPCGSRRNYTVDTSDAIAVARSYGIETQLVDLSPVRRAELETINGKWGKPRRQTRQPGRAPGGWGATTSKSPQERDRRRDPGG